jgi:hypothetical protein
MEFYIEILIIGKQSVADNVEKLYNCEISEYYFLDPYIKIYKFKTNKYELFDITGDRIDFVNKNIFPMIASDDPTNHYQLKIIVLLGINYEFSIHYKSDDTHTVEPNKMFIMNYDEQKNKEITYEDISIMSNNQFLLLNKNLPIHRKITRLMRYSRYNNCQKADNIIIDHCNTDNYKKFLDIIKLPISDSRLSDFGSKISIKNFNTGNCNFFEIGSNYNYIHYYVCSIWINLHRLVDHKCYWFELESKIIYRGKASIPKIKEYYLENLYSECNCEIIYVDSDSLPLLLNQLVLSNSDSILQTNDPVSPPPYKDDSRSKEEIQIIKHNLSIETKRTQDYKNAYLNILKLFNTISRKKIEPDEF